MGQSTLVQRFRRENKADILKKYELFILNVVLVMIMFVVFVCTIELGWIIIKDLYFNPPRFLLAIADIKEIFGFFLLLLIGLELLESWPRITFKILKLIYDEDLPRH